jgi:hypothetical protein
VSAVKLQIATLILAIIGIAMPAAAQHDEPGVATSFEQLRVLVMPGSSVTVTDPSGSVTSGRIASLTSTELALLIDDAPRRYGEMDVSTIRQRRGDSLANGARWGFGIGAGLAALALVALATCDICDGDIGPGVSVAVVALYGAMGTGVGVGVDALIRRQQTVYRRPAAAVSLRF